jgi:DNA-binding transcriptional MerR regulator
MISYSIKELGLISGIKPHTIRIWEKRYGILAPDRSQTNIRSYNDEQLKKILNVRDLIHSGKKISQIAKLKQEEISSEIEKKISIATASEELYESLINQLIISVSTFDEKSFEKTFSTATQKFGLLKTYVKIIQPALVRIGLMWTISNIMPAQEHFFSNLLKQKLYAAINELPLKKSSDQTWILFLNQNEEHELGLLFANYLLRKKGKKVIYLGSKVPYENIKSIVKEWNATHIYTFFIKNNEEMLITDLLKNLNLDFKKIKVCFSGTKEKTENISLKKNRIRINEIEDLINIIDNK